MQGKGAMTGGVSSGKERVRGGTSARQPASQPASKGRKGALGMGGNKGGLDEEERVEKT